jgi:hypothetical protein
MILIPVKTWVQLFFMGLVITLPVFIFLGDQWQTLVIICAGISLGVCGAVICFPALERHRREG